MKSYTINVYPQESIYQDHKYHATFDDYDPTPIDHDTPAFAPIGWGDTEYAAMLALVEQVYEKE